MLYPEHYTQEMMLPVEYEDEAWAQYWRDEQASQGLGEELMIHDHNDFVAKQGPNLDAPDDDDEEEEEEEETDTDTGTMFYVDVLPYDRDLLYWKNFIDLLEDMHPFAHLSMAGYKHRYLRITIPNYSHEMWTVDRDVAFFNNLVARGFISGWWVSKEP